MKLLQPIRDKDTYSKSVEGGVFDPLWEALFKPIFDLLGLKKRTIVNSRSDLKKAIRSGKLIYSDGYFFGQFNASVSKALRVLGAEFDHTRRAFKINLSELPLDIRTDIAIGKDVAQNQHKAVLKALESAKEQTLQVSLGEALDKILGSLDVQTVQTLPKSMEVPMQMSDQVYEKLKEDYHKNMELYINDFKNEEIERLRAKVEDNVQQGYRADRLGKIILAEFGVSVNKSRFLARQETSLLVSKFREQRYKDVGIKRYKWSSSHDERVRDDHKALDGKVFSFDAPPITNRQTGERNNPGEDFGPCRCIAIPIIED